MNVSLNRAKARLDDDRAQQEAEDDAEAADESWRKHRQREDSIIVDLFHGQLRSQLRCHNCHLVSRTFDPFVCLSVPLPRKRLEINVFFFRGDQKPVKYTLRVRRNEKIAVIASRIAVKSGACEQHLRMFIARDSRIDEFLTSESEIADELIGDEHLLAFEVIEGSIELFVEQRVVCPLLKLVECATCKRPAEAVQLRRCTGCLRVAYCDHNCQKDNWISHKKHCIKKPASGRNYIFHILTFSYIILFFLSYEFVVI